MFSSFLGVRPDVVRSGPMHEPPERAPRDLRIPLGGLSPNVVRRPRLRRTLRTLLTWPMVAAVVGIVAALAGGLMATAEPQIDVRLDAAGYRIDGEQLQPQGSGVYVGSGGAALVIARRPQGQVAGASAVLDGRSMTGHCETAAAGETCRFTVDGAPLSATDQRTDDGWHRTYSDGRTVSIHLTGDHDAPVPFAVGR
jgi:hypothetical protein